MRRLILQTGVSIDGYVAALDGSHPWNDGSEDEAVKRWILDSVWAAGAHLMGRVTYEEMAAFWPTSTSDYARPMNEIPKVVWLIDEYRLMIQPAALGAGLPLFKGLAAPVHLELVEATTYATGLAIHVYRPRSSPTDRSIRTSANRSGNAISDRAKGSSSHRHTESR